MVELDVHLSKDKVPVIYHDFNISIAIKKRITASDTDLSSDAVRVTHAVKELTLQELQLLKLSPVNNRKFNSSTTVIKNSQP
jgi:glycerophosphocholine phosphodiesterase GPCPD1